MKKCIERRRMIVDISPEIEMAIRLRAVKNNTTTGAVVCVAIREVFSNDVQEAEAVLASKKAAK